MTDTSQNSPDSGRDWYSWLLDPLPVEEFERDYYEQRLYHARRARATYFSDLLSVEDLDTVLGAHSAQPSEISLARGETDIPRARYTDSSGRVQPLDVAGQFDSGATVIFNQLQKRVPALAQLCVSLGRRFSSRVQTNVYLTPPEAQGFAPHWDTHDVFVLQVSGTKRWTIYDSKVRLPLRGQKFARGTPPGAVSQELELEPGSALYMPRGLMHSARSTGEASLHITLGITAFTWAEFLVECVTAAALEEESLRRNLPPGFSRGGLSAAAKERLLSEKLSVVASRFDSDVVWRRFTDEILAVDVPLFTDLLAQRIHGEELTQLSRVRRRAGLLVDATTEGETCVIRFCGREIRLPVRAWPALAFALDGEDFAIDELPNCLDAAGKITLARRLVREGILQSSPTEEPTE